MQVDGKYYLTWKQGPVILSGLKGGKLTRDEDESTIGDKYQGYLPSSRSDSLTEKTESVKSKLLDLTESPDVGGTNDEIYAQVYELVKDEDLTGDDAVRVSLRAIDEIGGEASDAYLTLYNALRKDGVGVSDAVTSIGNAAKSEELLWDNAAISQLKSSMSEADRKVYEASLVQPASYTAPTDTSSYSGYYSTIKASGYKGEALVIETMRQIKNAGATDYQTASSTIDALRAEGMKTADAFKWVTDVANSAGVTVDKTQFQGRTVDVYQENIQAKSSTKDALVAAYKFTQDTLMSTTDGTKKVYSITRQAGQTIVSATENLVVALAEYTYSAKNARDYANSALNGHTDDKTDIGAGVYKGIKKLGATATQAVLAATYVAYGKSTWNYAAPSLLKDKSWDIMRRASETDSTAATALYAALRRSGTTVSETVQDLKRILVNHGASDTFADETADSARSTYGDLSVEDIEATGVWNVKLRGTAADELDIEYL